jgi:hypothetical protein
MDRTAEAYPNLNKLPLTERKESTYHGGNQMG